MSRQLGQVGQDGLVPDKLILPLEKSIIFNDMIYLIVSHMSWPNAKDTVHEDVTVTP